MAAAKAAASETAAPRGARGRRSPGSAPDWRTATAASWAAFDGYDVQVLEYLEGRNLEDETAWPDSLYGRVADLVAAVHASTAAVRHLVERVERYELPFLPG